MIIDTYKDIIGCRRPIGHHLHMDISHRAKQFAPFAALKGFEETVYEKDIVYVSRVELAEDKRAELNFRMRMLQYGMQISATYFVPAEFSKDQGQYETVSGTFASFDPAKGITIGRKQIPLEDLYDLQGDGMDDQSLNFI